MVRVRRNENDNAEDRRARDATAERRATALKNRIKENYQTPGHPTAFSAPGNVARTYGISQEKAREILEELDSYVTHREYKRPSQFNPYFVHRRRKLIQADLIDIGQLADDNRQTKFLFLIIDVFSRKIWVYPLLRKTGPMVRQALEEWLTEIGEPVPQVFATDAGREFENAPVRTFLRERGIEQRTAVGTCKAAIAERANKSLQILLYKFMTQKQTRNYIDALDEIVASYNDRGHRTLENKSPNEADNAANEDEIREIHARRYAKIRPKKPRLREGQVVRIKLDSKALTPASRAYNPQFKEEYFVITGVKTHMPIPLYTIKSMDTNEDIQGTFYSNELTVVRGDVFKIERVLDERGHGRNRELLVRWMHFGPQWDEWIPASNVQLF